MNIKRQIITIGGLPGTGTTTLARTLIRKLGWSQECFVSGGEIYRQIAAGKGMALEDLCVAAQHDPVYDLMTDERTALLGRESDRLIFEGRLGWRFITQSLKVLLVCNDSERIRRIAGRDGGGIDEVRKNTMVRENADLERYRKLYGIENIEDPAHYDMVLDSGVNTPEEMAEMVSVAQKKLV